MELNKGKNATEIPIFPKHVWELILGELEDSKDILNVYKAIPELERERVFKKQAHLWLFEQVVPHIFPWIQKRKTLACRLVCRRWCRGVDNFLENHPLHRAYDHDHQVAGQLWSPAIPEEVYYVDKWRRQPEEVVFTTSKTGDSRRFSRLHSRDPERNPIVGRSVHLSPLTLIGGSESLEGYCSRNLGVVHKIGQHIWFVSLGHRDGGRLVFFQFVLRCLSLLPNLKGLKVASSNYSERSDWGSQDVREFFQSQESNFTALPNLESLEFGDVWESESLVNFLVKCYSRQVRKLEIPLRLWKWDYDHLFPNLTELSIRDIFSKEELLDLLAAISSPKLWSLKVCSKLVLLADIIPLLGRFPRLSRLQVEHRMVKLRKPQLDGHGPLLPVQSLKFLEILTAECVLDVDILEYFPSLEYLKLTYPKDAISGGCGKEVIYESGVWERLPRLNWIYVKMPFPRRRQRIIVITTNKVRRRQLVFYSRAGYEYWKRASTGHS